MVLVETHDFAVLSGKRDFTVLSGKRGLRFCRENMILQFWRENMILQMWGTFFFVFMVWARKRDFSLLVENMIVVLVKKI